MELINKLETKIGDLFKGAPSLAKSTKKSIADVWPWIVLVLGVLQLLSAWALWKLMDNVAQPLIDYANSLSQYYGTGETIGFSAFDKTVIYLAIAFLVAEAIIMLMAFKPLQAKLKRGWDLIFLSALLNVAYAVVTLFIDGRGAGTFVMQLIGSAVGFYFLFQIRELYTAKARPAAPAKSV